MSTVSRRRDPFFAEFDQLVRTAFGPSTSTGYFRQSGQAGFSPAAEAHRDGDDAVIRLELPGVSTEDVTVEVKGRHLVISGSRRDQRTEGSVASQQSEQSEQSEQPEQSAESEQSERSSGRRFSEFRYGSFTRSFRLAPSVTVEAVSASYDAGVLTVRVAGAYAETEGHKIEISTGAPELG